MAEIFRDLEVVLQSAGRDWRARACGRPNAQGLWEGWIEFEDGDGLVLRTERETTQPNRVDLEYWATGLTPVYLEGALDRAARPAILLTERPRGVPAFDGPREHVVGEPPSREEAILDPFAIYEIGEDVLRHQLGALAHYHLTRIARVNGLTSPASNLAEIATSDLIELIVAAVRARAAPQAGHRAGAGSR